MKNLIFAVFVQSTLLFAQTYPPHLNKDVEHHPFVCGVASGSPLPNAIMLWTFVESDSPQTLTWQIASDENFTDVVAQGTVVATEETGYTAKADVRGLAPDTRYFYRFIDGEGKTSVVGKTRTAPADNTENLKFAIVSCSSIYSGYFNAYRKLSQRNDLNVLVHLGDYIYDFVDEDEKVFVPEPFPSVPQNLTEWRRRHAYYLMDPDLRAARQNLPWILVWDNHDLDRSSPDDGARAFWEWNPVRMPDSTELRRIYRRYSFGNLADLILLDALLHRPPKIQGQPDTLSILGETQFDWFKQTLQTSTAKWRILGNQKLISRFSIPGLPGYENDNSPWGEYPGGRERFGKALLSRPNNVLVGGDAHIGFANDFADSTYNAEDRSGAFAPEFLPNSISRGNLDEQVGTIFGSPAQLNRLGRDLVYPNNPHIRFIDLVAHGYGVLNVEPDSVTAEFWFCPILEISEEESLAVRLSVDDGNRFWNDYRLPSSRALASDVARLGVYPNPAQKQLRLRFGGFSGAKTEYEIVRAADGKIVHTGTFFGPQTDILLNLDGYNDGMYVVYAGSERRFVSQKFLKIE